MDKTKLPLPDFKETLVLANGNTEDIISQILRVHEKYAPQLKEFAQGFQVPCKCPEKVAAKIWHWIKANIKYQRDPKGVQYIKSPARTIHDGFGDCKTYSIVAMSILQHLGIRAAFRFTSYSQEKPFHHVYVVIPHGNQEILLDAVWHTFNAEKRPIIKRKDVMPEIYEVSGIGEIGEIANAMEPVREEIRKELEDMRVFLQKHSINEKEKQIIANVTATFGTGLFPEAIIKAIETSDIAIFYTTVLNALRMADAPAKAEIGLLPIAAGLAAGRGIARFVRNGGLRKAGNVVKGVVAKIRQRKATKGQRQQKRQERRRQKQLNRQPQNQSFSPQEEIRQLAQQEPQIQYEDPEIEVQTNEEGEEVGFNLKNVLNTAIQKGKTISAAIHKNRVNAATPKKRRLLGRLVDKAKTKIKQIQQSNQVQTPVEETARQEVQKQQNTEVLARKISPDTTSPDATLDANNTTAQTATSINNNMIYIAAGVAALFFITKK